MARADIYDETGAYQSAADQEDQLMAELAAMMGEQQGDVISDVLAAPDPVDYDEETTDSGSIDTRSSEPYKPAPTTGGAGYSPDAQAGSVVSGGGAMPALGAPSAPTPSMPDEPTPVSGEADSPVFNAASPSFTSQLRVGSAGGGSALGGIAGGLLGGGLQAGGPDMGEDDPSSLLASLLALLGQNGGGQEF